MDGNSGNMFCKSVLSWHLARAAAPGYSSDQATRALEEVFRETMPPEMGFDYMGMSYQEQKAREGVSSSVIFGFSLLFVFLILTAPLECCDCAGF
jgi:hydrophobic/amphiphilic exporter-1 (mainly G- bacteria), HAE1 family